MRDLDYFTENAMDQDSLKFWNALPSQLKESVKSDIYLHRAVITTLQGYKGPKNFRNDESGESSTLSSVYGVQEISFRYATSKHYNWIPFAGNLFFTEGRMIESAKGWSDWSSLFFDEASGSHISKAQATSRRSGNKQSQEHNKNGERLLREEKYAEAFEEFREAWKACSPGYSMEDEFSLNKKTALNGWTNEIYELGCKLFVAGDHKEAAAKFKEAYDKSSSGGGANVAKFKLEMEIAERTAGKNEEADRHNKIGERMFQQEEYREAHVKFNEAYTTCSSGYKFEETFLFNRKKALNEWIFQLNSSGWDFFKAGKYREAEMKFKEALEANSNGDEAENKQFRANMEKAELLALQHEQSESHNMKGEQFFLQGKFQEAYDEFVEAHNYCTSDDTKKVLWKKVEKAQNSCASLLNREGNILNSAKSYREASLKLKEAYLKCTDNFNLKETFRGEWKLAEAMTFYSEGESWWSAGWTAEENDDAEPAQECFFTAQNFFEKAKNVDANNPLFRNRVEVCCLKIEGNFLYNEGAELQEQANQLRHCGKFKEALDKYEHAQRRYVHGFEASNHDERFKACADLVQDSIDEILLIISQLQTTSETSENVTDESDYIHGCDVTHLQRAI